MDETEYTDYEESQIITDEMILDDDFYEQHDRHAYMQVEGLCPNLACQRPTLEYQVFGMEKEIFCTSCDYHQTVQLQ